MTAPQHVVVTDYIGLIAALRARVTELGLSYANLDEIAGWHDGYSTKLLIEEPGSAPPGKPRRTQRSMGPEAFDKMLGATAVRLIVEEDPDARARMESFKRTNYIRREAPMRTDGTHRYIVRRVTGEFMRKIASKGGRARAKKLSKKRRRESAKKAAQTRWQKPQIVEITPTQPARK